MTPAGFERVLVPLGSACGAVALSVAVDAVDPEGGRLRLFHVRPWQVAMPPPREAAVGLPEADRYIETPEEALELIETGMRLAHSGGATADGVLVDAPQAMVSDAILAAAANWGADMIVLCRRRARPLGGGLRGSISKQVIHDAPCAVVIVREAA